MSSTDDASYVWPYLLPYVVLQPFQNLTKVQGILHHHWMLQPRSFILDSPLLIYIQSMMFGRTLFVFLVPLCPLWFLCAGLQEALENSCQRCSKSVTCTITCGSVQSQMENGTTLPGYKDLLRCDGKNSCLLSAESCSILSPNDDGRKQNSTHTKPICSTTLRTPTDPVTPTPDRKTSAAESVTITSSATTAAPPTTTASVIASSATTAAPPTTTASVIASSATTAAPPTTTASVIGICVGAVLLVVVAAGITLKCKTIKRGVGSERCMKYCKRNGRVEKEARTSSSNSSNPTVPSRQDEGSALLYSMNLANTVIAMPNEDTENCNGTGTDPCPIPGLEQNVATHCNGSDNKEGEMIPPSKKAADTNQQVESTAPPHSETKIMVE